MILARRQVGDAWQATPTERRIVGWVARGQAGPPPPPVIQVAASVTPCRHHAGPTVLDKRRQPNACGSAASLGGDVAGTDQIPMPRQPTMAALEPATRGLGDALAAGGAGGGGAPLIHQPHHHPRQFGLVAQCLQQVGAAPLPQPPVLHPAHVPVGNAFGIPDHQGPDPLLDSEGDDLLGGLMLGLVDTTTVARLHPAQPGSVATPTPRAALPALGGAACGPGLAGLLIRTVQGSSRHGWPAPTPAGRRPGSPRRKGG